MNYNYSLAREIYTQAWLVDNMSYSALTSLLKSIKNGTNIASDEKFNSVSTLSDFKLIKSLEQLNSSESFEGIGLIKSKNCCIGRKL